MRNVKKDGRRGDAGQILIPVALMSIILLAMVGLALDVGRIFITKAELSRSVDAAALAAVLDLPDTVQSESRVADYMAENDPGATFSTVTNTADRQIRVTASKSVGMTFLSLIGINEFSVNSTAVAGFGSVPVDVYLAIDATGSMGASPCNSADNNSGCPIKEAKDAATAFVDSLLGNSTGSGYTQVGAGAFRGCYNPPRSYSRCVDNSGSDSMVTDLSSVSSVLNAGIGNIAALGRTGTNLCLGMRMGRDIIFGPNGQTEENTTRFLIILSDGDNTYNSTSYGQGEPPTECRPTSPWQSDGNVSSSCSGAQTRERQLDLKTKTIADGIKGQNVEIYVVGFGACGSGNTNLCSTGLIGGTSHDNTADRNLLKCIASSTSGTNDHYFEVPNASDLPTIFTTIAQQIAHRLIE